MTNQIVIKLNEEKFRPIIENFKCSNFSKSDSETVGKILFAMHLLRSEKSTKFDNKTRLQYITEKEHGSCEEGMLEFLKKYIDFIKK